jgi:hypothetical protein
MMKVFRMKKDGYHIVQFYKNPMYALCGERIEGREIFEVDANNHNITICKACQKSVEARLGYLYPLLDGLEQLLVNLEHKEPSILMDGDLEYLDGYQFAVSIVKEFLESYQIK